MRKFLYAMLSMAVAVLPMLAIATPAMADAQFGDSPSKLHVNSNVTENGAWFKTATLQSFPYGGTSHSFSGSDGTGMAGSPTQYFAVDSAPNNDPNGTGYLTAWNFADWTGSKAAGTLAPAFEWAAPITGASNSSPTVIGNNVYVAGSHRMYEYSFSGTQVNQLNASANGGNLHSATGGDKVLSHPLVADGEIFVSSENGYLFGINPNTLLAKAKIHLDGGTDASPSLVTGGLNGTNYVAVGLSNYGLNPHPGEIEFIDPTTGRVDFTYRPNGNPIVGAVMNLGGGRIAWADYYGNLYTAVVSNGAVTQFHEWHSPSGTVSTAEPAFANGYIFLPLTNSDLIEYVAPTDTGRTTPLTITNGTGSNNVSTPEASSDALYEGTASGKVVEVPIGSYGAATAQTLSAGAGALSLTDVNLADMQTPGGNVGATMGFETGSGEAIFQNVAITSFSYSALNPSGQNVSQGAWTYSSNPSPSFNETSPTSVTVAAGTPVSLAVILTELERNTTITLSDASGIKLENTTQITTPPWSTGTYKGTSYSFTAPSYSNYTSFPTFTVASSVPTTATFMLTVSQPFAQPLSLPMKITWTPVPTVSLTANPTALATGQSSTLTVKTTNLQPGDKVIVAQTDTSAAGTLGSLHDQTSTPITISGASGTTTAVSQLVATYDYTAQIEDSSGTAVATSKPVVVTWAQAPKLALSPATQTVAYGSSGALTVSATGMNSTEYIQVTDESGNTTMSQNGFPTATYAGNNGQSSFSIPISGGGNTSTITDTFAATLWNTNGQMNTVNPVTAQATFDGPSGGITLTASTTTPIAGQPVTLTATGGNVQPYASIDIYEYTGGNPNYGSLSSSSITETTAQMQGTTQVDWNNDQWFHTSYAAHAFADSTASAPQTIAYQASLTNPVTGQMAYANVTVTWKAPTVTLTANPTIAPVGTVSTLTGSVNALPSNGVIYVHQASGTNLGVPPESVTQNIATSINYYAATQIEGYVYRSPFTMVTWASQPTIALTPTPSSQTAEQAITMNVTTGNLTAGVTEQLR